ncbi:uncharacterized protein LOC120077090 [Benincasa hispida]|uniref:uncharacterized protein LOC120077090 n=1 Tax=Benincasa hispida TaxID=102211 RepID=UPI001900491D|nr:uncharacterized protein LOC120077090 [Benincasa hispida]
MDVTFLEDQPFFSFSRLQGESPSEEVNWSTYSIPLEVSAEPEHPSPILLTNQVLWITYYRKNLRKETVPPVTSLAPVHESNSVSVPGMNIPVCDTDDCVETNNCRVDRDIEIGDSDEKIEGIEEDEETDGKDNTGEITPANENSGREGDCVGSPSKERSIDQTASCSKKLGEEESHDASLDLPIALRKGTRSCTKFPMHSYMTYSNLSPEFKALTTSLDTVMVLSNIHVAMETPEWKAAVMEEMRALEKNET